MSKTATLKGKITMDDSEFMKTLRRSGDRVKKWAKDTAGAAASASAKLAKVGLIGVGAAGVSAAGGMLVAAKAAADLGGQLSDASAVTGIAADKMLVLQQAFANAGMSGEGAAGVIAKLQAAIGRAGFMSEEAEEEVSDLRERISELRDMKAGMDPKEQAKVNKEIAKTQERIEELQSEAKGVQKAFQVLGLDRGALAQMDGADQLKAVFEAVGKLGSQADKMAALRMLRLPPELMVLAKDPNAFKAASTQLGQLVGIMANVDMVSQFDRISDILNAKPGILFKQMGAGFLKELTGNKTLQETLNWFEALDLTGIGETIGAKTAALIDIIRSTIETNGGDLWAPVAAGMELLSAKAMELFVSGTQVAAGAAMGAMNAIFSDEGGQLLSSVSGFLVGAFVIAAVQISRIMEFVIDDITNQLKKSPAGQILLAGTRAAKMTLNPAGAARDFVSGAIDWATGKPPKEKRSLKERFNDKIILADMTPEEVMGATATKAGDSVEDAGKFAKKMYEEIAAGISRASQGGNPAKSKVDEAYNRAVSMAGPNGQQLYDRFNNGTPSVPITMPPQRQMPQAPAQSPMQWTFPGASNKGKGGDTGPKQVELLEKVAQLLDRNLTALQVA
jgi:hypothetical protein